MNERNGKRAVEMTAPQPRRRSRGKVESKTEQLESARGREQLESGAMGASSWRVRDGRKQLESARWAREVINENGT